MAKLILSQNGVIIKEFLLGQENLSIGRKPQNEIQIDDITISGKHVQITVEKNFYLETLQDIYVEDLGSTNGTYVNGKKIKKHMLRHGDVIQVGRHEFKFLDEDAPDFDKTVILKPSETKPNSDTNTDSSSCCIRVLNGPKAGTILDLVKSYTTMGSTGNMVVISKRQQGYFASHVSGKSDQSGSYPTINGNPIGTQSIPLNDHDIIEISGMKLEFFVKS